MDELPPPLTFETRVTRSDRIVHFMRHHLPRRWIAWIGSAVAAALCTFVFGGATAWGMALVFAVSYAGFFIVLYVFTSLAWSVLIWRMADTNLALVPMTVRIGPDGYENETGSTTTSITWQQVDKVLVTKRFVRLALAPDAKLEILIPRRDLPDGGVETIQAFFDASRATSN